MTRPQVIGFGSVIVLLLVALVLGPRSDGPSATGSLQDLRAKAGLDACPTGVGPGLPDLVLSCLGGGPDVELRAAPTGRPTLVNVWDSSCGPCAQEADELVAFSQRAGRRVALLGVLTKDTAERGLAFSADVGWAWPSLVDPAGGVQKALGGPGLPVTLLVRGDGTVAYVQRSEFTSVEQITSLVATYLGVQV